MPLIDLPIFLALESHKCGHSQELWANSRKRNPNLCEYYSLFDFSSKAELSRDVHEGPALASGLSEVPGQAAKDHSLQSKKSQHSRQGTYRGTQRNAH
uniref:Uncharacterized protein n=1 Tax=Spermophilus dauricus TaxID=99837 RepID=A0A8C9P681_SPEDA